MLGRAGQIAFELHCATRECWIASFKIDGRIVDTNESETPGEAREWCVDQAQIRGVGAIDWEALK
jgi:hypothetical protein